MMFRWLHSAQWQIRILSKMITMLFYYRFLVFYGSFVLWGGHQIWYFIYSQWISLIISYDIYIVMNFHWWKLLHISVSVSCGWRVTFSLFRFPSPMQLTTMVTTEILLKVNFTTQNQVFAADCHCRFAWMGYINGNWSI